ncbi:MAG: hypothetical protein ACRDY4_10720 [Acidimicrobiia bacterium]
MAAGDELDAGGPDLGAAAGSMREAWRAEEEEWSRAAAAQWTHGRSLVDVARDLMHRGDTVAVTAAGATFTGEVTDVGFDVLRLRTASDVVDVQLALLTRGGGERRHARVAAPVVLRVIARARSGGRSAGGGPETFRARLLEHEAGAVEVSIGSTLLGEDLRGTLTVGRDQVRVCDRDGGETYVPIAWVSWAASRRE